MTSRIGLQRFALGVVVAAGTVLAVQTVGYAQSGGAFGGMAGVWSGDGTVSLDNGQSERIRCKATYAVSKDGTGLNQSLICASDSYKFNLKSNVTSKSGKLSGTWGESSRNVGGDLTGRANNGQFDVVVTAPTFSANLSLTTRGDKQNVTIKSEGAFRSATIALSRS